MSALRPRIVLYFTPTSGSCLDLAEVFWTKTADDILPHATGGQENINHTALAARFVASVMTL